MNISSKMTLELSKKDAETLVQRAIFDLLRNQYNITADLSDISISFHSTTEYDALDRGPGTPVFSGVTATIKQATPMDRSR